MSKAATRVCIKQSKLPSIILLSIKIPYTSKYSYNFVPLYVSDKDNSFTDSTDSTDMHAACITIMQEASDFNKTGKSYDFWPSFKVESFSKP